MASLEYKQKRILYVILMVLLLVDIFIESRTVDAEGTESVYSVDPRVPDPIPSIPILPQDFPANPISLTNARVIKPYTNVYRHPVLALFNLAPVRNLGAGYIWVSVQGEMTFRGETWYEINTNEYVPAESLWFYTPSSFHGIALAAQPERPFAWVLQNVQARLSPAGEINPEAAALSRYQIVQIFAVENKGEQVWYLVGPNQWINQIYVGKVTVSSTPEGAPSGAAWVEVNLFEQTMSVYSGDQLVYATLISSGLPGWDTPTGVFSVWHRVGMGKMSGSEGYSDYYFLKDVPWSLYFNQAIALHAAYWHNDFGFHHSHGCVNLSPIDAQYLWNWAPENLWVWVH